MVEKTKFQLKTNLPIERYLKKYVSSMAIIQPSYILSKKDRFGNLIIDFLGSQNLVPELTKEKFNEKIIISIPIHYENEGLIDFKTNAVDRINSLLKDAFYIELFMHLNYANTFGLRIDKSIESFCSIKNIELDVDIQYDTLCKRYQRYREENGNPIKKYLVQNIKN